MGQNYYLSEPNQLNHSVQQANTLPTELPHHSLKINHNQMPIMGQVNEGRPFPQLGRLTTQSPHEQAAVVLSRTTSEDIKLPHTDSSHVRTNQLKISLVYRNSFSCV